MSVKGTEKLSGLENREAHAELGPSALKGVIRTMDKSLMGPEEQLAGRCISVHVRECFSLSKAHTKIFREKKPSTVLSTLLYI